MFAGPGTGRPPQAITIPAWNSCYRPDWQAVTVHTTRKRVWRFVRNAQASAPGLRETLERSWYAAMVQGVPLGLFIFLVQIAAGGAIVQA
ncbi:MAG: hypothetical protein EBU21_14530, partial [Proteobacteria bacterium]|nr:hypothetical protein [Pseudomonadota bacterium]